MTIEANNIASFFNSKNSENKTSTLYKALSELKQLEDAGLENTQAYCMMIWSTIELLSRFYSGQLGNQQTTKRLKNYLRAFFPHQREYTQILLLFRNACMHSVSLHAIDDSGKKEVRFNLTSEGDFLVSKSRTNFSINPIEFKKRLTRSIEKYQIELRKDNVLQLKFDKVYSKIGFVN